MEKIRVHQEGIGEERVGRGGGESSGMVSESKGELVGEDILERQNTVMSMLEKQILVSSSDV